MSTSISARPRTISAPSTGVRLTRRGRLLVMAVLVAMLFAAFSLVRSSSQAAPVADDAPAVVHSTVVQPGESLWTLARRIAPHNDPREVIARIRELNDLQTSKVQPGQQLVLPVAA